MDLNSPIEELPNTSVITIRLLKSLEIKSYFDLLNYFPFRYENYSLVSPIAKIYITYMVSTVTDGAFTLN